MGGADDTSLTGVVVRSSVLEVVVIPLTQVRSSVVDTAGLGTGVGTATQVQGEKNMCRSNIVEADHTV